MRPGSVVGSVQQYLRNLISSRKVQNQLRSVVPLKDSSLDMEIPGEVQMRLDRIDLFGEILPQSRRYANCETIRLKIVRHPSTTPDQHCTRWLGSNVDQNAIPVLFKGVRTFQRMASLRFGNFSAFPRLKFMGRLTEGQFAKCG